MIRLRAVSALLCGTLLCVAVLGCPKAPLADIVVFPDVANVRAGETTNLQAKSNDPNDVTFKWTSSDTATASVDADGIVTGHESGTVTITVVGTHSKKKAEAKVVVEAGARKS